MPKPLLTRTQFRDLVFERDGHSCVWCGAQANDAHHIIDRSLFPDGGYYLDNGASLCEEHHLEAERTTIMPSELYIKCSILTPVLPPQLEADCGYDKWGNPVLPNGQRMRGEMFDEPGVQKMLEQGNALTLFTRYVKYPRTYHLPWSPGVTDDDRIIESLDSFAGKEVVALLKLDGENTSVCSDGHIHARSIDTPRHPSRDWVKNFLSGIAYELDDGFRLCGENVFAEHSIAYQNLESYFYGFSVWDDKNICLSWDDTLDWFEVLGVTPVPTLYRGAFEPDILKSIFQDSYNGDPCEGFVVRLCDSFHYKDFRRSVAKYVRPDHVQTTKHWLHGKPVVQNKLAEK